MENSDAKPTITVIINGTSNNSPGHASVYTTDEYGYTTHTSLYPKNNGDKIAIYTLGCIPVPGALAACHHGYNSSIFTKEISPKDCDNAVVKQMKIAEAVTNMTTMYAAFGSTNPIAGFFARLIRTAPAIEATREKFYKRTGFDLRLTEDQMGNTMENNEDMPNRPQSKTPPTANCVSTTTEVLNAAGIQIINPSFPSFFGAKLIEQGFNRKETSTTPPEAQPTIGLFGPGF